jgi:hypothetical protein
MRRGEYCAGRVGVTLTLYYGKSTRDLAASVSKLVALYLAAIPAGSIRSIISATGVWRDFTNAGLATRLCKLAAADADYAAIELKSGEPGNLGEYGFHFFGTDMSHFDIWPREASECVFEFPLAMLNADQRGRFEQFIAAAADIEPFESGHAGYAFKHLYRTWGNEALEWVAQKAPRFLGVDISNDSFSSFARRRVVNASWITLLGHPLIKELGGEAQIRFQLSPEIRLRSLATGLAIVAGDVPPIGDVSRGAQDLQLLKEVAALTRPVRAALQIGFGSQAFRRYWPNRLD